MEKLVDAIMQRERKSDVLDRAVLAAGIASLCLALAGTAFAGGEPTATGDPALSHVLSD